MSTAAPARNSTPTSRHNLIGALSYFTFIPALVFLLLDRYRKDSFVRFHSVQCLLCWLVGAVSAFLLRICGPLLLFVPIVGPLLATLVVAFLFLGVLLIWVVLLIKAFQGEKFALPLIGVFAEKYSPAT